jgi:hypothetical protein
MWFVYGILLMFIPIMGRVGNTTIPDLVVAGVSVFGVILLFTWQVKVIASFSVYNAAVNCILLKT